jgi:hypothetical protein
VTIASTSGSISQTTSVEVDVQASFMLSANPESLIVPTGSTAQTTTITLQPEGTFSGNRTMTSYLLLERMPMAMRQAARLKQMSRLPALR